METKLTQGVIIFATPDIRKTAAYYHSVLGFQLVAHYEQEEPFAALYRDKAEIILVQSKNGDYIPNSKRYGVEYDAYVCQKDVQGVDVVYEEFRSTAVEIVKEPAAVPYGSYEFVIKDIDGRLIGIGNH
jgi:catechol 2,3-dioxygenase-like lactoylglutathione lyase family enzyme